MHVDQGSLFFPAELALEELVETELPLTPIQEQYISRIVQAKHPEFVSFKIPLPEHTTISLDLIQYAWRAVASHNEVLRTGLVLPGQPKATTGTKQRIFKYIPSVQFCQTLAVPDSKNGAAQMFVDTSTRSVSASIRIHLGLIDSSSIRMIREDFKCFFTSQAFSTHPSLEKFIKRTISRDANAAKLYWRAQLAGVLSAPIHGFPTEAKALSRSVRSIINDKETKMMQSFVDAARVSTQSIFYMAWASILAVHTEAGNNRVVFSVVGRDPSTPGNLRLVGPIDQTYPLVVDVLPDQSVSDFAGIITKKDEEASKYAFIGYDQILYQASQSLGDTVVQISHNKTSDMPSVSIEIPYHILFRFYYAFGSAEINLLQETNSNTDDFILSVDIDVADEIAITIRHSELVGEAQARVLLDHYIAAIFSIVEGGAKTAKDIDLISSSEREYLMDLAKPLTEPVEGLVHQLFEAQVERTPDLPAVQFENDDPISYAQLNKLANGVARQLKCTTGSYVPVCMSRSANLIITLLAVLKTGAGYVTLDPDVPAQRNNFIFNDVSATFAITDHKSKRTFPVEVVIEDLVKEANSQDQSNLLVKQKCDDVVYVIYTSGSTGK